MRTKRDGLWSSRELERIVGFVTFRLRRHLDNRGLSCLFATLETATTRILSEVEPNSLAYLCVGNWICDFASRNHEVGPVELPGRSRLHPAPIAGSCVEGFSNFAGVRHNSPTSPVTPVVPYALPEAWGKGGTGGLAVYFWSTVAVNKVYLCFPCCKFRKR